MKNYDNDGNLGIDQKYYASKIYPKNLKHPSTKDNYMKFVRPQSKQSKVDPVSKPSKDMDLPLSHEKESAKEGIELVFSVTTNKPQSDLFKTSAMNKMIELPQPKIFAENLPPPEPDIDINNKLKVKVVSAFL